MDNSRRIIDGCSIGIKGHLIMDVGRDVPENAEEIIDGSSCFALPGLVNCHTHVYQSLIKGVGYDMHFNPWNIRYLVPIISHMGPDHARASAELAALEMIKSGTTAFSDHWYLHTDFRNIEEVAVGFDRAGLRNHAVFGFLNESFAGRKNENTEADVLKGEEQLLAQAERFVKTWNGRNLTTAALGPGSTEDVSRELFKKIIGLSRKLDIPVVTHLSGWVEIVSRSLEKHRLRDFEYAHSLGFTGPRSIAIHCVWLSEEEIAIAADTGTKIVNNPMANMHLGYGIAPVPEMISRGVTVGLGTDGAASYTYDMFEIGKTAAMLQKVRTLNPEALTAEKALEMMTLDGAKVLGLDGLVGSIEKGKRADIILVKRGTPHLLKGGRPVPQIVYSAGGPDVITSIIDGTIVMRNREVLTLNEGEVLARAQNMRDELLKAGGNDTDMLLKAPWPAGKASWRMP